MSSLVEERTVKRGKQTGSRTGEGRSDRHVTDVVLRLDRSKTVRVPPEMSVRAAGPGMKGQTFYPKPICQ